MLAEKLLLSVAWLLSGHFHAVRGLQRYSPKGCVRGPGPTRTSR